MGPFNIIFNITFTIIFNITTTLQNTAIVFERLQFYFGINES